MIKLCDPKIYNCFTIIGIKNIIYNYCDCESVINLKLSCNEYNINISNKFIIYKKLIKYVHIDTINLIKNHLEFDNIIKNSNLKKKNKINIQKNNIYIEEQYKLIKKLEMIKLMKINKKFKNMIDEKIYMCNNDIVVKKKENKKYNHNILINLKASTTKIMIDKIVQEKLYNAIYLIHLTDLLYEINFINFMEYIINYLNNNIKIIKKANQIKTWESILKLRNLYKHKIYYNDITNKYQINYQY